MRLSGRHIGLLKEYMHDLVEQAKQDEATAVAFGHASKIYRPDQAISDPVSYTHLRAHET